MSLFYEGFDPDIQSILLSQIRNLWTHSSTAIEGNSLTLGDTAFVLEEGLTVSGKPLRDHQEVYGHAKGVELVYRFLDSDTLNEKDIFALHRVVLTEAVMDIFQTVGRWKNEPNFTNYVGSDGKQHWRQFPDPENIPELMRQWLIRFNAAYRQPQDMESAAKIYVLSLAKVDREFRDDGQRVSSWWTPIPAMMDTPSVTREPFPFFGITERFLLLRSQGVKF